MNGSHRFLTTHSTMSTTTTPVPPNQTIYLHNLTEKLSKPRLRRQLYNLASKFGSVVDVHVRGGESNRGQAWVVFSELDSAAQAQHKLDDYVFFDKPIKARFAKTKSDALARLDGTYVARGKRSAVQAPTGVKKQNVVAMDMEEDVKALVVMDVNKDINNPPHLLLKVEGLPGQVTKEQLVGLFSKYEGFKEVRYVAAKNLAFFEFVSVDHAKIAKEGLKGYPLTSEYHLRLVYAKQG